jgi:hypothetical protein
MGWVDVVSSRVSSLRSGFGQTARELRGVMGALRSTQGKKRLNELVEQDFTSQMTETRSRELVKAFKFIDSDHSGVRLLCSGFLLACLLACLLHLTCARHVSGIQQCNALMNRWLGFVVVVVCLSGTIEG